VPPNAPRPSRTRKTESAADRKARRSGSTGSGQRQVQRTKKNVCRQEPHTTRALHGNMSRPPLEQLHQSVLSVFIRKRKTEEAGQHCLHEKVSHDPELDDEKQSDVESESDYLLTVFDTVAAPFLCPQIQNTTHVKVYLVGRLR